MGMGSGETTSTVHQSSLPEYAQPYYESLMDRAHAESQRPYQPYQGQRLSGPSNATQTGLGMAGQFASSGPGAMTGAMDMAERAGAVGMNYTNYQSSPINNYYQGPVGGEFQSGTFTGQNVGFGSSGPYGVSQMESNDFTEGDMNKYMSPYMQAVIDKARADNANATLEEQVYRNSEAARAGAFGGSRAAVQNQMALNAMQDRNVDISVQGHQAAFENAQQQFERDRQARMMAQQGNQQASLQAALANQGIDLEAQRLGEQSRQYGFSANQDAWQKAAMMQQDAEKFTEQFRQGAADIGLRGVEAGQRSAAQMAEMQGQWDNMMLQRIKAQLGIGQTQEDYFQEELDMAYNDFVNQRDAERQNLQFYSSLLQGVPISPNSDVSTTQPTNPLAGLLGTAGGLQALYALSGQG